MPSTPSAAGRLAHESLSGLLGAYVEGVHAQDFGFAGPLTARSFYTGDAMNGPQFQRQHETHPLGKCDSVVEIAVPQQLRDDLVAIGALSSPRKTVSEVARQILTDHLYGRLVQVTNIIER